DLVRDYQHPIEDLRVIRGRLDPVRTAQSFYKGTFDFHCEYDDFNRDTPLNRTLKTAARKVTSISTLDREVRKRAVSATHRMDEVDAFRNSDLMATTARNTTHYRPALLLARHLLNEVGRLPVQGETY